MGIAGRYSGVMGIYSKLVFPYLCDWGMSSRQLAELRAEVLSPVKGNVLEIGAGTGLNLPHYGGSVEQLVLVDPNPGMHRLLKRRLSKAEVPAVKKVGRAESLPFPDDSFDYVVSTFVMCSIPQREQAIEEIFRVLRPSGSLVFLEHGLSPDPDVRRWQRRLNPIQRRIGDGCRLDVDIPALVRSAPFTLADLREGYFARAPKFLGYLYRGSAVKRLAGG